MRHHRWSDAEISWLKQNIHRYSYKQLAPAFNQIFGTSMTYSNLERACHRYGIDHGRKHEIGFVKGQSNAFSMTYPIGTIKVRSRGRVFIKVREDVCKPTENWVQLDRYRWEQAYGKLDKNELLIHLDNNKENCDLANLYKVSRAVNRQLGAFGWFFTDPKLTLTAIKCCELMMALKQVGVDCYL